MIKITANTTDEQILRLVSSARENLAEAAADTAAVVADGERLVGLAQNVVSSQAVAQVAMTYRDVLLHKPENALPYLMSVMVQGPDDTWSGRGNDSRRSAHDAVRAFVRTQVDVLRFGR